MKKSLFSVLFCFCTLIVQAQTFFSVDGIRYLIEDDHAVVARQDKELAGDINIPATVNYEATEYNVTRLLSPEDSESGGGGAFQECLITGIVLPASITEIPNQTFSKCTQLSSVNLPNTLTKIGDYAFDGCSGLKAIVLPETVKELGTGAFNECSTLSTINIPAPVTTLSDELFLNTAIETFEIPANITRIGAYALANNTLTKVKSNIRDVRTISYDVTSFGNVTKADLEVPAGGKVVYQEYYPWMDFKTITEFGEDTGEALVPDQRHVVINGIRYMLKDGKALVAIQPVNLEGDIIIPATISYESTDYPVTAIQDCYWSYGSHMNDERGAYHQSYRGAFTDTQITSVKLPASITNIGKFAFYRAEVLKQVELAEGLTTIGDWAFAHCTALTDINIPSTVTVLPYGALAYTEGLKDLVVSEGVTTIGMECLIGSGIETLTLPSTCTLLGYQALEIPYLKALYVNVKEPTDIKAIDYNDQPATMNGTVFGHDSDQAGTRERLSKTDLIVPLGCTESYKVQAPWFNFRSITDAGSPYLKLNNSVFSAPEGSFTVTNTENNGEPEFEYHDGWYEQTYTHGLCLKQGTTVSFSTAAEASWIYVYLFSSNSNTVLLDGVEITNSEIGDDQSGTYSFRRYDKLVAAGNHTITCNTYEGNQWPCMFLLRVQNVSGDYYQPQKFGVNIDGINYVLEETVVEGQDEPVRTATIARQNTSLSGDITIPAKVSYAKTVLQDNNWVTLEAHDYDVTEMVIPGFEIDEAPGIHRTTDGAFQECAITSISLPSTLKIIPGGTFNDCQQLKSVTLAEGITTIGAGAFANCINLEDIYLPETVSNMDGWYIFGNCTNLKKVNIPEKVTSLGNGCFMRSGIETFLIPKNITSIGDACFGETNLKNIKICHESYEEGTISFPEGIFNDVSGITLIVPEGKKASLYSQVYPWKDFEDIIEYTDQNDEHQYNAYRVGIEEATDETPASVHRRAGETATEMTVGFTPSGVAPELPTTIEKDGKKYFVQYKQELSVMPAQDVILQVVLIEIGDVNGDGEVNVGDIVTVCNFMAGKGTVSQQQADVNGDGEVNVGDIVTICNIMAGR